MLSRREVLGLLPMVAGAMALPTNWSPVAIESDASLDDVTKEFMYLTGVMSWLEVAHQEAFSGLAQSLPENFAGLDTKFSSQEYWNEQKEKHAEAINEHLSTSLNSLVVEIQNTFSRAEMCKIIEFFRSPAAQKMVTTTTLITGLKNVQAGLQKTVMKAIEPEFAKYYKA